MLYRLRTDFRLSIITLLGACAILGITPFAVYRFYVGDLASGLVDSLILASIVLTVVYAWRTGKTALSGFCLAIFTAGGATLVGTMHGDNGIFWLYPTCVTGFFLTAPLIAVLINSAALLILVLHNAAFDSSQQMWAFVATSMMVSACSYIFSLRHERQLAQLERLAAFDPLTGIKNRRAMDQELQVAVAMASRTDISQALIMLDLDHFKRVNDNYGHSVGDQVLIQCARILENNIRQADHLFRFGGEEFVILMTGVKEEGLKSVLLNLRRKMETDLVGPDGTITASFGAALLRDQENWETWLARADAALYRAKDAGRDCIVLDGSDGAPLR